MCSICLQNPCHPKCPNAVRRVRGTCDECGEELYEDEYYVTDDMNGTYCSEECAKKQTAYMRQNGKKNTMIGEKND